MELRKTFPERALRACLDPQWMKESMHYRFYCDTSYDGSSRKKIRGKPHIPRTVVMAGLVANGGVWDGVEALWTRANNRFGVSRFHASHLNCRTHEYAGWDVDKQRTYSRVMLRVLGLCGKSLGAVGVGMFADDYERTISAAARAKLGSPYIACFNSLVTGLARLMVGNPPEDRFSVFIDKDEGWQEAQASFEWMRDNSRFAHKQRLLSCTPTTMDDAVCLQTSDLIAYELFKAIEHHRNRRDLIRKPMKRLLRTALVREGFFDEAYLKQIKPWIEETPLLGRYLVHTPAFESYHQVVIDEDLERNSRTGPVSDADPSSVEDAIEQEHGPTEATE